MDKENFISQHKKDIKDLNILIQAFNEIKPIILSFDNKVYNKRLKTALDTVVSDKYVILNTVLSFPHVYIGYNNRNKNINHWFFKVIVKEQNIDANIRIDASKTIAEINKEIGTMQKLVEDKKVWINNADLYEAETEKIMNAIKAYKKIVPLSLGSKIRVEG